MAESNRRIRIFNLEARGLRVGDSGGSSDPYAILTMSGWRQQTSVQKRTLEPVWVDADYKLDESKIDFNKHFTLRIDLKDKVRCRRMVASCSGTNRRLQNFIGSTDLGTVLVPLEGANA